MKSITYFKKHYFLLLFYGISFVTVAQDNTWFKDITNQLGGPLFNTIMNHRIYAVDVNNDDYPDLLLEYGTQGLDQLRLFINTADSNGVNGRTFVETTLTSGINEPIFASDMATVADFNNDGNVDFITNVWVNLCNNATINARAGLRIYMGDGRGNFNFKTGSGLEKIGVEMAGSCLPALDFDRDGNLDFFVGTQYDYCTETPGPKYFMKGNGDGTFTNVTDQSGISANNKELFGSNVADWNNDCNQDIITAPYTIEGYGNLFKNNGNGTFTDVGDSVGYNLHWMTGKKHKSFPNGQPMVSWEAMPADYDNDGDIDFLVPFVHGGAGVTEGRTSIFTNQGAAANYALIPEINRITRNNPQGAHKGDHKANWMDFDNDGLVDMLISEGGYNYVGERLYFEKQDTTNHFNDITATLGFITGESASTISTKILGPHAVEPIDFDMDGDDDIVVGCVYNAIPDKHFLVLENKIGTKNNYIKIKLIAPIGTNKSCIGARIKLKAGGVWYMREIYAGQGHLGGQQPFALNFGLGQASTVDSIIVTWPDAKCSQTTITDVATNQFIVISQNGYTIAGVKK